MPQYLRLAIGLPALLVIACLVLWAAGVPQLWAVLVASVRAVIGSCAAGSAVPIAIIVGPPTLGRDVRTLVAVAGIVLGATMTAATLTGRRLADGLHRRRDEVEAWLSIGATPARRFVTLPAHQCSKRWCRGSIRPERSVW